MSQKQFSLTLLLAVISAFLGGTLGVWFLMPQSVLAQGEKVIEAQEFRIVDSGGTTRATLGLNFASNERRVGLHLFDQDGKVRVELEHDSLMTGLFFRNDDGIGNVALQTAGTVSRLSLSDNRGDPRRHGGTRWRWEPPWKAGSTSIRRKELCTSISWTTRTQCPSWPSLPRVWSTKLSSNLFPPKEYRISPRLTDDPKRVEET